MTSNLKIRRRLVSSILCGQQWWNHFMRTGLKVALGLPLAFSTTEFDCAADAPAPESRQGFSTFHLAKVPSDAPNGLGSWIWADKTFDRQTCRLWKEFDI